MIFTLTGFMGCGKTSYGRLAARKAGCAFLDLDEEIVRSTGRSIPSIFRSEGEEGFRRIEAAALVDAIGSYTEGTLLIALGGGTLGSPASRELIRACSHCIYLKASPETIARNLREQAGTSDDAAIAAARPKLAGPGTLEQKIAALMEERLDTYESAAVYTVDTDEKSPDSIVGAISGIIG